ncbi:MAG: thiolase family protein [Euryarchaeota archaeon]|nr:thiolase family protein [Euryarchaeota archaeon]MBT3971597.1 thiolase family protein [Euryarchaeota archaeon]MBT4407939.1 thiolase family protein [Euryarchaeota archaeon]MBT6644709.1 thiolase family protein [Euryarchaeota archaeon]
MTNNPVICGFARSPFTPANKGSLAKVRPDDIAAAVIVGLLEKIGVDKSKIEDVIVGCAFPEAEQGFNLGRMVTFLADLPSQVSGVTVNRFCGSSMQAIHDAAGRIAMGAGDAFICGGVESMTRIPMSGFNPLPNPRLATEMPEVFTNMGLTAENLASLYEISREDQQSFAIESHNRAVSATTANNFSSSIIPIETESGIVSEDGCIRGNTNQETLNKLRPAFLTDGSVTAGTSSPLTDGAAFVFVCSESFAKENGLTPLARIKSIAVSGCSPEIMGIGPVEASRKALERAGLSLEEIDIVELNEAFAAQSLAVIEEMGLNPSIVNIDGGALALGHPLGASGARIVGRASEILARNGSRVALATMCIGGGQGIATILEKVD